MKIIKVVLEKEAKRALIVAYIRGAKCFYEHVQDIHSDTLDDLDIDLEGEWEIWKEIVEESNTL